MTWLNRRLYVALLFQITATVLWVIALLLMLATHRTQNWPMERTLVLIQCGFLTLSLYLLISIAVWIRKR